MLQTLPDLQVGGGQVMALNAIRRVDPSRYRFDVLALHPDTATMTAEFAGLGVEPFLLEPRAGLGLADVARVARLLRRRRIDLVHSHGHDERQIVLAAALAAGVPAICQLNSEWVHLGRTQADPGTGSLGRLKRAIAGRIHDAVEHRATRLYLASSEATETRFRPYVRAPIRTLTHSVAAEIVAAAAAPPDPADYRKRLGLGPGPVAVNVARAVPGKGQDRLLRSFARVLERVSDAQLLLVGDGELHDEHRRLAAELRLQHAVQFLGGRRDVADLLVGADLFVFASTTESFGLVVAEAMAARLPVVAYRLASLDGFCGAGVTGAFPDQDDEAAFVDAVVDLLTDPAKRRRQGDAGAAEVLRRFPVAATAASYEAAYRQVLEGDGTTRRTRAGPRRSGRGPQHRPAHARNGRDDRDRRNDPTRREGRNGRTRRDGRNDWEGATLQPPPPPPPGDAPPAPVGARSTW